MTTSRLAALCVLVCLLFCSCDNGGGTPPVINPDRAQSDLRKPAQPVEVEYPHYPKVAELGPEQQQVTGGNSNHSSGIAAGIVTSILNDPKNVELLEGAIAVAIEKAPAIIEEVMGDMEVDPESVQGLHPDLEGILNGDIEISPEAISQASELIAEHAPGVLEEIMAQSNEENESLGAAIVGLIFQKIFEAN